MAKPPSTIVPSVSTEFNRLFPSHWLRRIGRETGAMQRHRQVDIVPFFWTLLLGPAGGRYRTLASLQRVFQLMGSCKLVTSAFLKRFHDGLVRFLRVCTERALAQQQQRIGVPAIFRCFRDVLLVDSTLIAVTDALASLYPGPRKNTCPAAIKVNTIYSITTGTVTKLTIAPGTRAETRFLRIGKEIQGKLLLFDLGYFSYSAFERIDFHGGFFISRMKKNANPVIVGERRVSSGRHRRLVGEKLWDVIGGLKRDLLDVDVEVIARRKLRSDNKLGRKTETSRLRLRVVGVRNPDTGNHHVYITNVACETMTPEQIAIAYSNRWVVELLFRELKHCYGLRDFPSSDPNVVKALIYAALLRVALSRTALSILRRRLLGKRRDTGTAFSMALEHQVTRRTPELRAAEVFSTFAPFLLPEVLAKAGVIWERRHLESLMFLSMLDPNKSRELLCDTIHRA